MKWRVPVCATAMEMRLANTAGKYYVSRTIKRKISESHSALQSMVISLLKYVTSVLSIRVLILLQTDTAD